MKKLTKMGYSYKWFDIVLAMAWASRWRKAYKCKRLLRRLKQRIEVQKNRMNAIIRQARSDIAQLLQNGQLQLALSKVEQLHTDQCRLAAYNQLYGFCDCLFTNLSGFTMPSKFSNEAREAVSSMIYASARCSELPELHSLRGLFKKHFGKAFERINVRLLPGNMVNSQTKQNLTRQPAMEDIKLELTDEIANEYAISSEPQLKLLVRDNCIAYFETKKNDNENETKYKNPRSLKLQGVLQKIRSNNNTFTSSNSVTEQDFYHGTISKKDDAINAQEETNMEVQDSHISDKDEKKHVIHVHPKLPDYEHLAARFEDLKRQHAKNQTLTKWMRW